MIQRYTFTGSAVDREFLNAACAWLEANGIEPQDVPVRARFTIADGQLTYEHYVCGDKGRLLGTFTKTVPLLVSMPPELDERADFRIPPRLCDRCQADLDPAGIDLEEEA